MVAYLWHTMWCPTCRWDWGPAFAPAGIVGDVQLLGSHGAFLTGMPCLVGTRYPCALPATRVVQKAGGPGDDGVLRTGCNIRQEHSADGTVQLLIDCVLRNPRGCAQQSGEITAELRLDEVSLQCSGSVDISADVSEHVHTLEVTRQSWWQRPACFRSSTSTMFL